MLRHIDDHAHAFAKLQWLAVFCEHESELTLSTFIVASS